MFNLGLPEILVISAASLLIFGPKRLPELAKGMGKGIRDFKRALEGTGQEDEAQTAEVAEPQSPEHTISQSQPQKIEPIKES